jgi:hypothetical protein
MIQVRSPPAREVFAAGYRYPLDMSARWRWGFVIVFVVAALGAFMPNLLASGTAVTSHTASLSLSEHPVAPTACVLSSCNKGGQTPGTLSGKAALEWAVLLGVLSHSSLRVRKQLPLNRVDLPRGIADVLLHPPQP